MCVKKNTRLRNIYCDTWKKRKKKNCDTTRASSRGRSARRVSRGTQEDLIIYRLAAASSWYLNSAGISRNTDGLEAKEAREDYEGRAAYANSGANAVRDSLVIFQQRNLLLSLPLFFSLFLSEQNS